MKAIIFARVSSKDQEDGQSIPAQVRRLTEYALRKAFTIDNVFQITESSSKETRKQFEQIISYVKKSKEPFALITDTVDRLQRSFKETPMLDELRKQGKLELHFLREGLIVNQSSNSSQLLQWDIGVLFASSYVRQLSDNVKRSQEECRKNGQWISKSPYGYKNVTLPDGSKDINIDPEQASAVTKIFELYAQGNNSYQTVAEKMRIHGFAKTSRGKSITVRTVELILKNPFYTGKMLVKGQLHRHKYQTLITEAMFNRVQSIIANHHKVPVQYAGKPILLRGLIKCKNCGSTICGDIKKQKYVYYSCHNTKRICIKKWIREEKLLDTLLGYFDNIKLSDAQIDEIVGDIETNEIQQQQASRLAQQQLNQKLSLVTERISRLVDLHVDNKIDARTYQSKLEEYTREQNALLLEIQSEGHDCRVELIAAQDVLELAQNAKEIFMSSKLDEKQQLLGFFFSNLQLDNEKLDVELREPFNLLANVSDQHKWRG